MGEQPGVSDCVHGTGMLGLWLGGEELAKKWVVGMRITIMGGSDDACCQCLGTSFPVLWLHPCTDDCSWHLDFTAKPALQGS